MTLKALICCVFVFTSTFVGVYSDVTDGLRLYNQYTTTFKSNDIGCKNECDSNSKCDATSFNKQNGICYLFKDGDYFGVKNENWTSYFKPEKAVKEENYVQIVENIKLRGHYDSINASNIDDFNWMKCWFRCEDRNQCSLVSYSEVDRMCYLYRNASRFETIKNDSYRTVALLSISLNATANINLTAEFVTNFTKVFANITKSSFVKGIEGKNLDSYAFVKYINQDALYRQKLTKMIDIIVDYKRDLLNSNITAFLNLLRDSIKINESNLGISGSGKLMEPFWNCSDEMESILKHKYPIMFIIANLPRLEVLRSIAERFRTPELGIPYRAWIEENLKLEKVVEQMKRLIDDNSSQLKEIKDEAIDIYSTFLKFEREKFTVAA